MNCRQRRQCSFQRISRSRQKNGLSPLPEDGDHLSVKRIDSDKINASLVREALKNPNNGDDIYPCDLDLDTC